MSKAARRGILAGIAMHHEEMRARLPEDRIPQVVFQASDGEADGLDPESDPWRERYVSEDDV